jgi:hypothetical protein
MPCLDPERHQYETDRTARCLELTGTERTENSNDSSHGSWHTVSRRSSKEWILGTHSTARKIREPHSLIPQGLMRLFRVHGAQLIRPQRGVQLDIAFVSLPSGNKNHPQVVMIHSRIRHLLNTLL